MTVHDFDRYTDVVAALTEPALVPVLPASAGGPVGASVAWPRATDVSGRWRVCWSRIRRCGSCAVRPFGPTRVGDQEIAEGDVVLLDLVTASRENGDF